MSRNTLSPSGLDAAGSTAGPRRLWTASGVALAAGSVALLVMLAMPLASPYLVGIATELLIFAIFAMSLNLLIGYTGLMSFGHAAFFGLGAYATIILGVHLGLNGWAAMLAGVGIALIGALIIGIFCIRVSGIAFMMLTMAFSQLLYSVSIRWRSVTGGSDGIGGFVRPGIFDMSLENRTVLYYVCATGFLLVLLFLKRLIRSPLGSIFIGIRDNEQRMRSIGYPVQRFKLLSFAIAGTLAGVAGALYANLNAFVSSDALHWHLSGDVMVMVILGGTSTIFGPVVGAAIFLLLRYFISSFTDYWSLAIGIVFVLCVMFLRQGIWGVVVARLARWRSA
jgi:branched-chain amino acid transport system permease protein